MYQKIVIVGVSGSGKSTLAGQLSKRIQVPVTELDALYWQDDWQSVSEAEFTEQVKKKVLQDRWILCGNYNRVRETIWDSADTLIWLDYSFFKVFFRLLFRSIQRAWTREKLWETNNQESFLKTFFSKDSIVLWMIQTHGRYRAQYPKLIEETKQKNPRIKILRFQSESQLRHWMKSLSVNAL